MRLDFLATTETHLLQARHFLDLTVDEQGLARIDPAVVKAGRIVSAVRADITQALDALARARALLTEEPR